MIQFFKNIWNAQNLAEENSSLRNRLSFSDIERRRLRKVATEAYAATQINARSGTVSKIERILRASL